MVMGCDTLLMVGTSFPYAEWLPEEGQAPGRARSTSTAACSGMRYPMEVEPGRRRAGRRCGADPAAAAQGGPLVAGGHREGRRPLVAILDGPGAQNCGRPDQPAARLPRASAAAARRLHPDRRLRLGDQLVGAAPEDAQGDAGGAVGHAGDDGARRAVRARRQVRLPRPAGDRVDRRRRDADARHERADHIARYCDRWANQQLHLLRASTTRTSTRSPGSSASMAGDPKLDGSQYAARRSRTRDTPNCWG